MNLTTDKKRLIDTYGRERIFNGINMIFKGIDDPSAPGGRSYIKSYTNKDFANLKRKGINLIRLGIIWDAIEHEMGVYNDEYLNWIETLLDQCKTYDIGVFLDMHQDLYSRLFDGGAPEWATLTDTSTHTPGNLWSDAYLFSDAVNTAFKNFWQNKECSDGKGLIDHYSHLWQYLIRRFGNHEAIIGYDFMNEPFPGQHSLDIMKKLLMTYSHLTGQNKSPDEMIAAFMNQEMKYKLLQNLNNHKLYKAMAAASQPMVNAFDQGPLKHFYYRMTKSLRQISNKGLVFTENSYFSNMGIESGIEPIIVDNVKEPLQVFSPHGYDLLVDTPAVVMASNSRIKTILDAHLRVQDRLKTPVIFGEWGAHGSYQYGLTHIEFILNYFDRQKWSHTYYCWEDGIINYPVMDKLSRPYPQATAGEIIDYGYNFETNTFHHYWFERDMLSVPTVIYIPKKPIAIRGVSDFTLIKIDPNSYLLHIPSKGQGKRQLNIQL